MDFTYIMLEDRRKWYNCNIIDLYDRSVVAPLNSSPIDATLTIQTLEAVLDRNLKKDADMILTNLFLVSVTKKLDHLILPAGGNFANYAIKFNSLLPTSTAWKIWLCFTELLGISFRAFLTEIDKNRLKKTENLLLISCFGVLPVMGCGYSVLLWLQLYKL